MNNIHMIRYTVALSLATLPLYASYAVTPGQVDTFEDLGLAGWGGGNDGSFVTQSVAVESDGGPLGAGDAYLAYASGPGSNPRMVVPFEGGDAANQQWRGDYGAAGVDAISFDVLNDGSTDLNLRLAVGDASTWFGSTDATIVSPGSGWVTVEFPLDDASLSQLSGGNALAAVLSDVTRIRILSSVGTPPVSFGGTGAPQGDRITASIGLDNITALPIPEPASLVAALAGAAFFGRRRR